MNGPITTPQIVIVDDDRTNAELFQTFLQLSGFKVTLAFSGKEGFRKIIELQPALVILDLYLPDVMGSEVCSQLRANKLTRNIPVIMCTAKPITHGEKMKGFRAGVFDYMVRPFQLEELLARIHVILRRTDKSWKEESAPKGATALTPPTPSPTPSDVVFKSIPKKNQQAAPVAIHHLDMIKRWWEILNHPQRVLDSLRPHEDFFLAVVTVLATPFLSSLLKMTQPSADFDAWIGFFSLGLITHLLAWVAIAGMLHMVLPFLGVNLAMRPALLLAGLSWAPRFLSALFGTFYGFVSLTGWIPETNGFSSGLDLIPGLANVGWISIMAPLNLFNVWAAALVVMAFWTTGKVKTKKWNTLTFFVGGICLLIGLLAQS